MRRQASVFLGDGRHVQALLSRTLEGDSCPKRLRLCRKYLRRDVLFYGEQPSVGRRDFVRLAAVLCPLLESLKRLYIEHVDLLVDGGLRLAPAAPVGGSAGVVRGCSGDVQFVLPVSTRTRTAACSARPYTTFA